MDIYCPRCGEPWEHDHVQHDMAPEERDDLLTGRGCSTRCRLNPPEDSDRCIASSAILELCPDDLDGAAALMEDAALGM